jgi:phenylacetate-CoA ligase
MRSLLIKSIRPTLIRDLNNVLKSQWFSKEQIKEEQNRKFINLINHCQQNTPYYQKHGNLSTVKSIDDITAIPILTKDIINAKKLMLLAQNYSSKNRYQVTTSGSTGKQFHGYFDRKNKISWVCTIRGQLWAGYRFGAKRIMLWNKPSRIPLKDKIREVGRDILYGRLTWLSVLDLSDEQLYKFSHTINKVKPEFIIAYTNALDVYATFLERNDIKIHSPKAIVGTAMMMFKHQRERIERIFATKIYNSYASVEFNHIAGECERRNGLHISSEHIYLEIVDENGNPSSEGTPGQLLVTDLTNYAFPLIRYKIGDLGSFSENQCECGRGLPLLKELFGRNTSVTVGRNGMRVTAVYWIDLLKDKFHGIEKFQVKQDSKKNFQILLQIDDDFNQDDIKHIKHNVRDKFGELTKVSIQIYDEIPQSPGGKHQWIISAVSPFE